MTLPVDDYAPLAPVSICDPSPKPGVQRFRDFVLARWGGVDLGISRDCGGQPPTSKHHEGRAWDWGPPDRETADRAIAEMLAVGPSGEPHELARRAGLRVIIWWRRIWVSRPPYEWHAYARSPHTDHVHFGLGWPGAMGETSLYQDDEEGGGSDAAPTFPAPGYRCPCCGGVLGVREV